MWKDVTFRSLPGAPPPPVVFTNPHAWFMEVSAELCPSSPPIGTLPSNDVIDRGATKSLLGFKEKYKLNEWRLMGAGDILLLCTDGLIDHACDGEPYFPLHLEATLREVKHQSAKQIVEAIKIDALDFAP